MEKTVKSLISWLLLVVLVLSVPVMADALSIPKVSGQILRTEILEIPGAMEADQRIRTVAVYETPVAMRPFASGDYSTDPAEVGAVIRQAMMERADSVTVHYEEDASVPFQQITDELLAAAMAHTGEPTAGDYLQKQRGKIKSSASYYPGGATNQYDITFTLTYYTTAEQEQAVTVAVNELLTSLNLDGLSDYEKVQAVYDWMCQNITYDYDNLGNEDYKLQYTAYGALIDRTSVCQGYATLLYRLMLELGIDCRIITGDAGGRHAWNIIELDGRYYNADSTWDAPRAQINIPYDYFLRCPANFTDHIRDGEFDTAQFHAEYPMAESDYVGCQHSYSVAQVVLPSCTQQGYTCYVCDLCGHEYTGDYVDPTGHNYVDDFIPPTCTGIGYLVYTCTYCGDSYSEEIPELGHTYVPVTTEPTCEAPGFVTYTCALCGDSYTEQIPMLGHDMGVWYVEVEPGEYTEGLERRNCMRCDYHEENVLPAIGHTHHYESVVTEPTCTEGGYTTHTCTGCGDTYIDSQTAALGHDYHDGTCTRCGAAEKLVGDVNGDGRVNARDARALLRFLAGLTEPGEVDEGAADFNGDGRVNARDARAILRAIAGLD